jgi:hypothetical protein
MDDTFRNGQCEIVSPACSAYIQVRPIVCMTLNYWCCQVSANHRWAAMAQDFGVPAHNRFAASTIKTNYHDHLLEFEKVRHAYLRHALASTRLQGLKELNEVVLPRVEKTWTLTVYGRSESVSMHKHYV